METRSRPVKVFDIQHQTQSSNSGNQINDISDMAISLDGGSTNSDHNKKQQQNFSLVKLYMKQKSMSAEGESAKLDMLMFLCDSTKIMHSIIITLVCDPRNL